MAALTKNERSHSRGWNDLLREIRQENTDNEVRIVRGIPASAECDVILVDTGMIYDGGPGVKLNAFGGEKGLFEPFEAAEAIVKAQQISNAPVYGLEYDIPWDGMIKSMRGRKYKEHLEFVDRTEWLNENRPTPGTNLNVMSQQLVRTGKLIIGDSHSGSSWESGFAVYRNDRRTLQGSLNRNINDMIKDRFSSEIVSDHLRHLRVHFGNIDVRFHIGRQENPREASRELARRLEEQLVNSGLDKIDIVLPFPIETEARTEKTPKNVRYRGSKIVNGKKVAEEPSKATGTREERVEIRNWLADDFRNICARNGWNPIEWLTGDVLPEHLMETVSIHLSPAAYLVPRRVPPKAGQKKVADPVPSLEGFFE